MLHQFDAVQLISFLYSPKLLAEEYIDTLRRNCTLNNSLVSYSQSERVKAETRCMIGKIRFLNLKSCLKKCFKDVSKRSCFHLNSCSSAFIIRAALIQTIVILINILTRHELQLKDVVLNKFPFHFFQNFRLIP